MDKIITCALCGQKIAVGEFSKHLKDSSHTTSVKIFDVAKARRELAVMEAEIKTNNDKFTALLEEARDHTRFD